VLIEAIALLAGRYQTATTELVYRHQIVPAVPRSWTESSASALAIYVHRVLTCRGDTPALDL